MRKLLTLFAVMLATESLAGSGMSGGTPPSRQQLEDQLMSIKFAGAGLFDNGAGDVALLANRELQPQLNLSRNELLATDIKISEADFERLRDRLAPLDSVGALGENRSFRVSAGDQVDSLMLTDRRATARAAVVQ